MRRLLLWLIVVVLLGGVAVGGYKYWYIDYPITADPTDPRSYPTISWNAVVDGRLARSLVRQAKLSKVRALPETVVPVLEFARVAEQYRENNGVDRVELGNTVVKTPLYSDADKRPFTMVAYYQTKINDEVYYLLIQRWRNQDGSESYLSLILPENKVVENGGLTEYYRKLIDPAAAYFYSPVFYFYNRDVCQRNMGGKAGYCAWLFGSEKRVAKYLTLMDVWLANGVVPSDIGRYPAYVMVTPLYRETK